MARTLLLASVIYLRSVTAEFGDFRDGLILFVDLLTLNDYSVTKTQLAVEQGIDIR